MLAAGAAHRYEHDLPSLAPAKIHFALRPIHPRYWAAAERLGGSGDAGAAAPGLEGLRPAFVDMVTVMQQARGRCGK